MDDVINRNNSIAEENIDPNGRPAINKYEEWSIEIVDRTDNVFHDIEDNPCEESEEKREKRIREMDEVIKEDLK